MYTACIMCAPLCLSAYSHACLYACVHVLPSEKQMPKPPPNSVANAVLAGLVMRMAGVRTFSGCIACVIVCTYVCACVYIRVGLHACARVWSSLPLTRWLKQHLHLAEVRWLLVVSRLLVGLLIQW